MQTHIAAQFKSLPKAKIADHILRNCVHCGFCSATCPTYLQTGNELNSPRGRIYLIKEVLEGQNIDQQGLQHLDLCLQCHNCETTCPSGVDYGQLYEIGQQILQKTTAKPLLTRLKLSLLIKILPYPIRFALFYQLFRLFSFLLPKSLRKKLKQPASIEPLPAKNNPDESIILFQGCVQQVLAPEINQSIRNLLGKLGKQTQVCRQENCCGAIDWHAGYYDKAIAKMKRNIDLWHKENKKVIISASGCSSFVKEYPRHLADSSGYAQKASEIIKQCFDTVDYFTPQRLSALNFKNLGQKIACHTPCTLQHWQKKPHALEAILQSCGLELVTVNNAHLCCGSAGLYSTLNPKMSEKIKQQKIADLNTNQPDLIVSNNLACMNHLQQDLNIPIKHWCEVIDEIS